MTPRRFRFRFLTMQLAVAGYVCPNAWADRHIAELAHSTADCGGDLDTEQPGLCKAHAQYGKQSLDKPLSAPVAPFAATTLLYELRLAGSSSLVSDLPDPFLARASAPPLTISHCCFRI
jgi:hypothetical protein